MLNEHWIRAEVNKPVSSKTTTYCRIELFCWGPNAEPTDWDYPSLNSSWMDGGSNCLWDCFLCASSAHQVSKISDPKWELMRLHFEIHTGKGKGDRDLRVRGGQMLTLVTECRV